MTSAEGVTGRDKKPLNSQHASVDTTKSGDVKDRVLMDLVNGFVQEIIRKGMAKYQEDIKSQKEHNVTVGEPCFANCKEKSCKPLVFLLVYSKQLIRYNKCDRCILLCICDVIFKVFFSKVIYDLVIKMLHRY